jgi:hypothetical protein
VLIDLDLADLLGEFTPNPFVAELHAGQSALYYEPARFRCGLCARRWGKSYTGLAVLLGGQPGDVSLYFTRKFIDAKAIMLPAFRDINYRFQLGLSFNLSDHTITEPNGAVIRLAGVKDESAAEDLRGPRYRRVVGDECGTFHSELLRYVVEDVVQPALVDSGGDLLLIGTPGPDPDPKDYWFQLTGDPVTKLPGKWPTHHGTIYDNTKARVNPRVALADILRQNNWTEDHPTFRREYLAEWVPDVGSLVFDYQGIFAPGPESGLTVLSLDFGVVDHTSFTILRQKERPQVWVMQSYSLGGLDIYQIAEIVQGLRQRWRPNHIVGDEGGLGKGYALTLNRQYNIPIEPAEKRHLRARIDMGRGMLGADQVHLTEEATELHDEWKRLPWNPLKTGFHDRYKADCTDGFLYGLQKINALEAYKPPEDNRTEAERMRDMARANALRAANRATRGRRAFN